MLRVSEQGLGVETTLYFYLWDIISSHLSVEINIFTSAGQFLSSHLLSSTMTFQNTSCLQIFDNHTESYQAAYINAKVIVIFFFSDHM